MSNSDAPAAMKAAIVPVTPLMQNCTLLWAEATRIGCIFDPGGDVQRIMDAVRKAGITVERIYLTHGHVDHASGATELADTLNVPIHGPHRGDQFLLDSLEDEASSYGIFGARNVKPACWLVDGERVLVAGQEFEVRHCPGHTPGSVVYVNAASGLAIVGDVLFRGSVGRTDFPYGSHETLIQSIASKLLVLDDGLSFVPGHGPMSTIGAERNSNPFLRGLYRVGGDRPPQ